MNFAFFCIFRFSTNQGATNLGTGYWVLGTGYWVLGTGYWVLGTGYWVPREGSLTAAKAEATGKTRYVNV